MAKFAVDVAPGASYEVDAPDEDTAWQWANQTHSEERRKSETPGIAAARKQLAKGKPLQIGEAGLGQAAYEVGAETPERKLWDLLAPERKKLATGVGSGAHILARALGLQGAAEAAGLAEPGAEEVLGKAVQGAGPIAKVGEIGTEVAMTAAPGAVLYRTLAGAAPTAARGLAAAVPAGAVLGAATTPGGLPERAIGAGFGAAGGAAGEVGGRLLARTLAPKPGAFSPEASELAEQGVRVPIWKGKESGLARTAAERGKALPITGAHIREAEQQAARDVNRLMVERATPPEVIMDKVGAMGVRPPKPVGATGQEAVRALAKRFDDAYGRIYAGRSIPVDDAFQTEAKQLAQQVKSYHPAVADEFAGAMREVDDLLRPTASTQQAAEVSRILGPRGEPIVTQAAQEIPGHAGVTADAVKDAIGSIDRRVTQAYRQGNGNLAEALLELKGSLQGLRERGLPPGAQDAVAGVNKAYRTFLQYQNAMGRAGTVGREAASPQQMLSAMRQLDRSKGKAAFSRGNVLNQTLAQQARNVLGNELPSPGPGTAEKLMGMATLLNPKLAAIDIGARGLTRGTVPTTSELARQAARAQALRELLEQGVTQTAGAALAD